MRETGFFQLNTFFEKKNLRKLQFLTFSQTFTLNKSG